MADLPLSALPFPTPAIAESSAAGVGATTAFDAKSAADIFSAMLAGRLGESAAAAADAQPPAIAKSRPDENILEALLAGIFGEPATALTQPALPLAESAHACEEPYDRFPVQEQRVPFTTSLLALPSAAGASDGILLDGRPANQSGNQASADAGAQPSAAPRQRPGGDRIGRIGSTPPDPADLPVLLQMAMGAVALPTVRQTTPVESAPGPVGGGALAAGRRTATDYAAIAVDESLAVDSSGFVPYTPTPVAPTGGGVPADTHRIEQQTSALGESHGHPVPSPGLPANYDTQTPSNLSPITPTDSTPMHRTLTGTIGTQAWREEFASGVHVLATQRVSSAELRVHPEELGPVLVSIKIEAGEANITCAAQHSDTRHAMEAALPRLRELLEASGISVGSASVGTQHPGNGAGQSPADGQARSSWRLSSVPAAVVPDARPPSISNKLVDVYA